MPHTTDKIFVSYSRHDEAFARKIAVWLAKTLNIGVWIDVDDIQPGVKWSAAIQDGLDNCEVMVVIVTPESMKSVNVEDEWQYFIDLGKPVVPILLRSAPIPYQLRRIQYIDFSVREEYNEALRLLIVELRQHLKPLNNAEREAKHSTGTMRSVSGGMVTPSKKAVRNKERMEKAEDLLVRQEKALKRNNTIITLMGVFVLMLAVGFGGFAYYVYINQPQLFYIRSSSSDAMAYLPNEEEPVPVSALKDGQAPEGTRFETGTEPLEISSVGGAEAVIQPNSGATIGDFNEESVALTLQGGNLSLDTAGLAGEIITPNGISISAQQNIEVEVDTASSEVSASCFEGTCTISDNNDGRSRELEEGSQITFSSTERDFDTAEILNIPGAIVFSTHRHGATELYLMSPTGESQTRITQNTGVQDDFPVWSPDGSQIAFVSDISRNLDIFTLAVSDLEAEAINLSNNRAADENPAWSPDGSRIAFDSDRDGNKEIYVMNADGSNVLRITDDRAADTDPSWSADSSQLAFVSTRSGNPDIFIVDLNDLEAEPVNVSLNPAIDNEPAWSPDGTRIAYTSNRDNNMEIYIFTVGSSPETAVNLTNNTVMDNEAAWSPDSTRIIFTTQLFGNNDIVLRYADGSGEVIKLSDNETAADQEANWLPIIRAGQ